MAATVGSIVIQTIYSNDKRSFTNVQRGIEDLRKNVNKTSTAMGNLSKSIAKIGAVVASAFAVAKVVQFGSEATKVAMQVEAATQQVTRTMADSSEAFLNWAKTSAIAYNMSRAEAIKYGAIYSNLISTFSNDSAVTAKYTIDLLKASAVVASSTGRTMEDVMERIRSGMLGNTEAIEDLGINVNIAMIESTEAFKRFANGKSWNQLDFQLQQQIRLFAILEQSAKKYGTEVNKNTASSMQQFIAQLKNVQLSLGQAFLPIVNVVLPILTSFAAKLAQVAEVVAAFSQRIFGKPQEIQAQASAISNQASAVTSLGDSIEDAGKQAKKASKQVASFDQVIMLSKPDADSEVGSSGVSSPSVDLSGLTGAIQEADKALPDLEGKLKSFTERAYQYLNSIGIDKSTIDNIVGHSKSLGNSVLQVFRGIAPKLKSTLKTALDSLGTIAVSSGNLVLGIGEGIVGGIDKYLLQNKGRLTATLSRMLDDASVILSQGTQFFSGLADSVTKFFKLETTKQAIADFVAIATDLFLKPKELLLAFIADVTTGINTIFQENKAKLDEYLGNASALLSDTLGVLKKMIQETFDTVLKAYDTYAKPAIDNIANGISLIVGKVLDAYNNHIMPTFSRIVEKFSELYERAIKPFVDRLVEVVGKLIFLASEIWNRFIAPIIGWLVDKLAPVFSNIFETVYDVVATSFQLIMDVGQGLLRSLGGIIDFITGVFTGDWKKAWEGVKDIFGGIWDSLVGLVKFPLNLIIDAINAVIRGLNKIRIDVPDWVPVFGGDTWGINIPQIPKLAKGGLTVGATLAEIGEGRYQEAVLPLNDQVFGKLSALLVDNLPANNRLNSAPQINVTLSPETLILLSDDDSQLRRLARRLKTILEEEMLRTGGGFSYGF